MQLDSALKCGRTIESSALDRYVLLKVSAETCADIEFFRV